MAKNRNGAIVLVTFSRPLLLARVLESIQIANKFSLPLIVIYQKGNQEVLDILQEKLHHQDYLFQVSGDNRSTLHNISLNRLLGYKFAFSFLNCDFVLAFEDDVLVSEDIFEFSEFIFEKYANVKRFRGINFGSHENFSQDSRNLFSLQRFGIHGPASGITAATWKHFDNERTLKKAKSELFDGIFEPFIKSGFMVTPTNSRFLDLGVGGTHTSPDSKDPYFEKMSESFVQEQFSAQKYESHAVRHSWRTDVFQYSAKDNLLFDILRFCGERRYMPIMLKLERAIYKVFILPRISSD